MNRRKLLQIACILIFIVSLTVCAKQQQNQNLWNSAGIYEQEDTQVSISKEEALVSKNPGTSTENILEEESEPETDTELETETETEDEEFSSEEQIYSFSQGPRAWKEGRPWSGEWCNWGIDGNYFGDFGCGLCCMANVYDTLSPYEVSPWGMYEYAQKVSGYSPNGQVGAISWENMSTTLQKCGFVCKTYKKASDYETFRQQISNCKAAIVLVSAAYDSTFWNNTYGHYVCIWLYDSETDTVFLSDPGMPERNRRRIPLRYVYDALKMSSNYQYLIITEYIEENNRNKLDGINEKWNRPFYARYSCMTESCYSFRRSIYSKDSY